MTLVDGGFVLIVGTDGELAAADAALVAVRLDGVDEDVVGMVVVVLAEAAAMIRFLATSRGRRISTT